MGVAWRNPALSPLVGSLPATLSLRSFPWDCLWLSNGAHLSFKLLGVKTVLLNICFPAWPSTALHVVASEVFLALLN